MFFGKVVSVVFRGFLRFSWLLSSFVFASFVSMDNRKYTVFDVKRFLEDGSVPSSLSRNEKTSFRRFCKGFRLGKFFVFFSRNVVNLTF